MEAKTTNTTNDPVLSRATVQHAERAAPVRVLFGLREVVRLTGLSSHTLKYWCRRGWVKPVVPGRDGHERQFSAWQVLGLVIVGSGHRAVRTKAHSYIGRTSIIRAMESLQNLSDEMLLPEHQQDPKLAETVSAIAHSSFTSHEYALTPDAYDRIAWVLEAMDRKVRGMRDRGARRM